MVRSGNHRQQQRITWSAWLAGDSGLGGAAGEAIDGALFVAGGAVFFLLGDGGQVGGVVFGRHGYGTEEEAGERWVAVEDRAALGVDVEEIEGWCGGAAVWCELGFNAAEEELEDGCLERMEEEREGRGAGEVEGEGVLLEEADGGECWGGSVGGVGGKPMLEVGLCGVG
jgi:hypothetical protein